MTKSNIYKSIMEECSQMAGELVNQYLKENLDTGEISFDDAYEMEYVVDDMCGDLSGYIKSIVEDALEDSGDF